MSEGQPDNASVKCRMDPPLLTELNVRSETVRTVNQRISAERPAVPAKSFSRGS